MITVLLSVALAANPRVDPTTQIMRENMTSVFVLLPYLGSPREFRDPENAALITASLENLGRLQHGFMSADTEPTTAAISRLFAQRVGDAKTDFEQGHTDAARLQLRSLTGLCLGCHSRSAAASGFPDVTLTQARSKLSPAEQARLLASVRQFDAAIAQWLEVLRANPRGSLDAFDQSLALRSALGVAVRAKDDPKLTAQLIETMKNRPLPAFAARNLNAWADETREWAAEKRVAATSTPDVLFARARELIATTTAGSSVLPDEAHLIALLRSSAYLNLSLARAPRAAWRGEALYLLGLSTGALPDPDLWQLDGLYLEACVLENPHTALAEKCVDRLADRSLFLYSGGGGGQLPAAVRTRLDGRRARAVGPTH